MIYGTGFDIINIKRFKDVLKKHGELFLSKIYTDEEISLGKNYVDSAFFFAGRWAAKEALSKALGTGIGKDCKWLDINIIKKNSGQPHCVVSGKTKSVLDAACVTGIFVSISHDKDYICASVILETDRKVVNA
jgi:holo-[acyl-carrier protein] synthase